jgi:hypothetical protein
MTHNVLMKLTTLAGLAICPAIFAQAPRVDLELVFDNDPRLAAMGVNYGGNAVLPGPQATAVGITLIGRSTTHGTTPNFGLLTFGSISRFPTGTVSMLYHNDALSNQTAPGWTSAALAMGRGVTSSNTSPSAARGVMSYTQPAGFTSGQAASQSVNYRLSVSGTNPTRNTLRTNALPDVRSNDYQPLNTNYRSNSLQGSPTNSSNGWVGVNLRGDFDGPPNAAGGQSTAANDYPNTPGSAAILGISAFRTPVPSLFNANGDAIPTLVNFGGGGTFDDPTTGAPRAVDGDDQDPSSAGDQSPWYAVYRMMFFPRPSDQPLLPGQLGGTRNVTVTALGLGTTADRLNLLNDGTWVLTTTELFSGPPITTSVTFQVPSPSSAIAFVIGLAAAARRRRR